MSRPRISLPARGREPEHQSPRVRPWHLVLVLPALLTIAAVAFASVAWGVLSAHSARPWGDLLFVGAQNMAMAVSIAYAIASASAMVARRGSTYILVAMFLLTAALFALTPTRAWLSMMGSREFRATRMESQEEVAAAANLIAQSPGGPPLSTALVPHALALGIEGPSRAFDVRPQTRRAGGPPIVGSPLGADAGLDLGTKARILLEVRSAPQNLDPYPPAWAAEELSLIRFHPTPPARRPRPRRR